MEALDNLVKVNQLKAESADATEFAGMLKAGDAKLADCQIDGLSDDSQFSLAYSAAHAFSLAALRWHGYRSDKRYIVFQCLKHTLGLDNAQWRILDQCHRARNLAEYEGHLEINPQLLKELIVAVRHIQKLVKAMPPIEE